MLRFMVLLIVLLRFKHMNMYAIRSNEGQLIVKISAALMNRLLDNYNTKFVEKNFVNGGKTKVIQFEDDIAFRHFDMEVTIFKGYYAKKV
jgi:hypothetical protein